MGYTSPHFGRKWGCRGSECSVTDERLQFVARRLAGAPMAELCREFAISRKIGYKIFDRYQECRVQGLTDRSRRPYRYAHQLPFQVENYILNVKREHPSWGARKPEAAHKAPELQEEEMNIDLERRIENTIKDAMKDWTRIALRFGATPSSRHSPTWAARTATGFAAVVLG
jgi:hypothetical protein